MGDYNLTVPSMGESINEVTISRWLKKEGDFIKKEEVLLEITTDKINSEIISPINGFLKKKIYNQNNIVKVGSVIAILSTNKFYKKFLSYKKNKKTFYSPIVRKIAKEEKINLYELETINGTGIKGRITKDDILTYIKNKSKSLYYKPELDKNNIIITKKSLLNENVIKMDKIREITSKHMINSKKISAHVTSFVEADVTNIVKWREKTKKYFQKNTGEKLTIMSIFVKCIVKAIKDYPMINISVNGTDIIIKKNIHIGIATALSNGNLIVPVIKNADFYNLLELVKIINDLIKRARSNKLKPDETQGGTYTISNIGSFGNLFGTPIINQPQVAIMAIGLIHKKLSIMEDPNGDFIEIRYKIYLSHSYDHRVIDGVLGGGFVKKVALYLEKFNQNTKI
ncbi:dihydrolipoamide acetyltransferase family protein [Blattabacterium cuenoti]|uniref:dihydrolipoamide acetyltransferase family protein n=1 Tax=Blattabacterium cuenoti TaxID=1653831 RepID=UPI00163C87F6|nr:dihydrolipoamide acetyltransferase family protein [Blattabacterium cuenoti]